MGNIPSQQAEVVAFLRDLGAAPARIVSTHTAMVFLAGDTALKIKRAVRFDYLDFSTLEKRRKVLRRELSLNRAFAPRIYRDVVAVTREDDGRLALDGLGDPVEWVLRMARFPAEAELSAIADSGGIDTGLARRLGQAVARYHAAAPIRQDNGATLIAEILDELRAAFDGMGDVLDPGRLTRLDRALRAQNAAQSDLLSRRGTARAVRRCHGDLHLGNIVLLDGTPVPFDALEFDERLGTCDVLYDLAFLLMDLWFRGLQQAANLVLNAWLETEGGAGNEAGLAALPLFLSVRAAIRAMVDVQTARRADDPAPLLANAQRHVDAALAALEPTPAILVAIGGLSGSGKSSVAMRLAPGLGRMPGALHLRSDIERKALFNVDPLNPLQATAYTPSVGARVSARMRQRATAALAAGQAVVLDATHLSAEDRRAAEQTAASTGVPFVGIWLAAPEDVLVRRVSDRRDDASDADAAVVHRQGMRDPGPMTWHRVDASGPLDRIVGKVLAAVRA